MQRDIIAKLNAWKASEYRKPLILKGARQVGKTWALKEFGRTSYRNFVYLTLEEPSPGVQSEYAQFFRRYARSSTDHLKSFPGTWTAYRARRNAAYY